MFLEERVFNNTHSFQVRREYLYEYKQNQIQNQRLSVLGCETDFLKNLLLAERSKWKEGIQGTGLASKSLDNMLIFKKKILVRGTSHLIF